MADLITATEYLEINSVPLATPAWRVLSLVPLWGAADLKGGDVDMPGVDGSRPYRRRPKATTYALPMVIWGHRNREGTPYGSVRTGLDTNIEALHTAIVNPPGTLAGTRTAIWHYPGGGTRTVDLHVLGLAVREFAPSAIRATLQLSIPEGRFT